MIVDVRSHGSLQSASNPSSSQRTPTDDFAQQIGSHPSRPSCDEANNAQLNGTGVLREAACGSTAIVVPRGAYAEHWRGALRCVWNR